MHLKLLTRLFKHLTSKKVGGSEVFSRCILEECNCCCILSKVSVEIGHITFYKGNESACHGDSGSTFYT